MSDKFTDVAVGGDERLGGYGVWGHEPYDDAVSATRRFYEYQRDQAVAILRAIDDGDVRVYHQFGPYAAAKRVEVPNPDPVA